MELSGNTVLITGGGTGIGRALAEGLHRKGNVMIVSGRRRGPLDATVKANPGMASLELDIADPASVAAAAAEVRERFPALNMLINNAGIMHPDDASQAIDPELAETLVATNFLGAVRMSAALVAHLKQQPCAAIVNVTSVLGFVPFARAAIYSATKAALHAYTLAQRHRLRGSSVRVIELVPPRVELDPEAPPGDIPAVPVADFAREVLELLGSGVDEIVVDAARPMRANPGPHEHDFVTRMNDLMATAAIA